MRVVATAYCLPGVMANGEIVQLQVALALIHVLLPPLPIIIDKIERSSSEALEKNMAAIEGFIDSLGESYGGKTGGHRKK